MTLDFEIEKIIDWDMLEEVFEKTNNRIENILFDIEVSTDNKINYLTYNINLTVNGKIKDSFQLIGMKNYSLDHEEEIINQIELFEKEIIEEFTSR